MKTDRTVLHLQIARTLRSITQGIAVVDLTLYLKALHWTAAAIGGVLTVAGLVGALLIVLVGVLSDKVGRKPFLLVYETIMTIGTLLMTFTANPVILTVIIVVTGFGRGQNGAAGPFTPAEQAWMAAHVPQAARGQVFSMNNALGFFGMAIGALLGGANHLWQRQFPLVLSYRPLFFVMFILSLVCLVVLYTTPNENRRAAKVAPVGTGPTGTDAASGAVVAEGTERREENRNMLKLASVNALNGLAIGLMGPMMSYWFATKFGVSSAQIGVTLALSFVFTGVSSLVTSVISKKFGMVKSVVWLQVCGVCLILILPLFSSFFIASAIYIARSALSRGTQGARSALSTSLTRDERRGFSVSMNALSMRLSSSIGPTFSGYLLDTGALSLPFYISGTLQLASSLLYGRLFSRFDKA